MILSASKDASLGSVPVRLTASGVIGGKTVTVNAEPLGGDRAVRQAYLTVLETSPFRVELPAAAVEDLEPVRRLVAVRPPCRTRRRAAAAPGTPRRSPSCALRSACSPRGRLRRTDDREESRRSSATSRSHGRRSPARRSRRDRCSRGGLPRESLRAAWESRHKARMQRRAGRGAFSRSFSRESAGGDVGPGSDHGSKGDSSSPFPRLQAAPRSWILPHDRAPA